MDALELAELVFQDESMIGLLPLELPNMPSRPCSSLARLRSRHTGRMQVWREACKLTLIINDLDHGNINSTSLASRVTKAKAVADRMKVTTAVSLTQRRLLSLWQPTWSGHAGGQT